MYSKPALERLGSFRELTEDIVQVGDDDIILFCANPQDQDDEGDPRS